MNWIKNHYKNLNSNGSKYCNILKEDTLNFEKLYNSYNEQKIFNVLFIKYECLYFNHTKTIDAICKFTNVNSIQIINNNNNKWKGKYKESLELNLTWDTSLQQKINAYDFKLLQNNTPP